jgi:hypothetical protein
VAAAFVDECGTPAGGNIKLGAVRLAALDQLVGPVTHGQLPLAGFESAGVLLQPLRDLSHAPRAAQVCTESGEPVIDNVRVSIIETGQHCGPSQPHHSRSRIAKAHQLRSAARDHTTTGYRKVAAWLEPGTPERADAAARKYELCFQARLD